MSHINGHTIFAAEQFGFRQGHFTTHQLLRVANVIRVNKSDKFPDPRFSFGSSPVQYIYILSSCITSRTQKAIVL